MALETATYLGSLVATNPAGTDPKSLGDDHLRLIKSTLLNSFAGFTGAVLVYGTEAQGATANDYVLTISPAPAAYAAGTLAMFKATHANTGAAQVQINALGYKPLVGVDNAALSAGDIESGAVVLAVYDGTSFVLLSGADRVARAGDTMAGTHNYTGATLTVATQAAGDNSTKAASTAYVDAGDAVVAGTVTALTSYVNSTFAPLASPALTGTPTAPTPANGDNSTKVATTGFVTQAAFQAALPDQTGNAYKVVTTDGTTASWAFIPSQYTFDNNV